MVILIGILFVNQEWKVTAIINFAEYFYNLVLVFVLHSEISKHTARFNYFWKVKNYHTVLQLVSNDYANFALFPTKETILNWNTFYWSSVLTHTKNLSLISVALDLFLLSANN